MAKKTVVAVVLVISTLLSLTLNPNFAFIHPVTDAGRANSSGSTAVSLSSGVWGSVGPSPVGSCVFGTGTLCSGRVTAIALDPSHPGSVYLGADMGGIWKSDNGGFNWAPLTDNQPSLAIGSIAIDPSGTIYAGTGVGDGTGYYGAGILKSSDSGKTWTQIGISTFGRSALSTVLVNPKTPNILIASTDIGCYQTSTTTNRCFAPGVPTGVYVSSDSGNTWSLTLSTDGAGLPGDLAIDSVNPSTVYAAVNGGVYKSINNGTTWNGPLGGGLPPPTQATHYSLIAVSASSHLNLIASLGANATKLYRSNDGGTTWLTLPVPPPFNCNNVVADAVLAIDPTDNRTFYVGNQQGDLCRTTDGGSTWTDFGGSSPFSGGLHPDQHAFAFSPTSHTTVYDGNDGGIWYSTNATTCSPSSCWTNLNAGLSLTEFRSLAAHPTNASIYFGGTQDQGTVTHAGGSSVWREFSFGGDGGWTAFDRHNPLTMYATPQRTFGPSRSDDGGSTWHTIRNGLNATDRAEFYTPLAMDPTTPTTLYLGTYRLYKTVNRGDNWTLPNPGLSLPSASDDIVSIAVAPSNGSYVFVGTLLGKFFVSTDGGVNFVENDVGLPGTIPTKVAVDPTNPQKVYMTFSGFGGKHVFASSNAGSTWTDITSNLPDFPAESIALGFDRAVYVGTDTGVFTLNGTSWAVLSTGLPRVPVLDLVFAANGALLAATYGRSVFSLPILRGDFGPTISFSLTVTFSAATTGGTAPYKFSWTFGDGTSSTASSPTHVYQSSGSYSVTLVVTDSSSPNALTVTVNHLLTVLNPSQGGGGGRRPLEM